MVSSKKKDKKRVDLDTRPYPNPIFKNYDYTDAEADETSPGGGLYHGEMGKYKSVTDFLDKKRKGRRKRRKKLLEAMMKSADIIPYEVFKRKKKEQELAKQLGDKKDLREFFPRDLLEPTWKVYKYSPLEISAVLESGESERAYLTIEYITEDDVKFDEETYGNLLMKPHVYFHLTSGSNYKDPVILPLELFLEAVPTITDTIIAENMHEG